MSIYQEYYNAQKELEDKCGKKSVVLMQVGSFYEIYGVNVKGSPKIGYAEKASEILSMQLALKNGNMEHSAKNPHMVGFPQPSLGNHLSKLLRAGFSVAVYDQFDSDKKDKKDRKLVNIFSASTYIDEEISESNALMVIGTGEFICPLSKKNIMYCRCVVFDLRTGDSHLTEIYNTPDDSKKVDTELYRIIHTFNPCEIIYSGILQDIEKRFDLFNKNVHHLPLEKNYENLSYQNQFLKKVYKLESLISPIEELGLNRNSDLIPYFIQGLQYAYEHDPLIISKMKYPSILESNNRLILNNDSIYQLHLVDQNHPTNFKCKSLFSLLNKTKTPIGKRLLKQRLLIPTTEIETLRLRYNNTRILIDCYDKYELRGITDLDLIHRKLVLKKLQPYELERMQKSFKSVKSVLQRAIDDKLNLFDAQLLDEFNGFYEEYLVTFDFHRMQNTKLGNIKESFFLKDVCPEIDVIQAVLEHNFQTLMDIADTLSNAISTKIADTVKIEFNLNDKYHLKTTSTRFDKIKNKVLVLNSGDQLIVNELKTTKLKTTIKITSDHIAKLSKTLIKAEEKIAPAVSKAYFDLLEKWGSKYGDMFIKISNAIAEIDFAINSAKIAKEFNYIEPEIDETAERSFLCVESLRHPIIEKIVNKTNYVSNNFEIGVDKHYGTILYGVNMSGKSSLLRSIGIAVVMAQAGMYVAADSFTFHPFNSIISKITVQDNPFKGQSLYMVEMDEVNNMLRRADKNTLVLSDELCSSTETSSAHAIVACTLDRLAKKEVNFVFSTHLHELQKVPKIIENESIKIMHFKVHIQNGEMIFDRTLQEGGIPDTYGLEIASALGLPKDFINDAFTIRDTLRQEKREILSTKQSRYNKDVFMDHCSLCGTNKALETHHIMFQCTADDHGTIKTSDSTIHKNQQFNLIVVCRDCHIRIHQKQINLKVEKLKIKI